MAIINHIEKLQRAFLWESKGPKKKVSPSELGEHSKLKSEEGFGITTIKKVNECGSLGKVVIEDYGGLVIFGRLP